MLLWRYKCHHKLCTIWNVMIFSLMWPHSTDMSSVWVSCVWIQCPLSVSCRMIPNISTKCTQTKIQYELLCPIFKKPLTKFLSDLSLSPIKVIIVVATCYFLRCNVTLPNTTLTCMLLKILKFKLFVFPNTAFFIIYTTVVIMAMLWCGDR